jgi:hypothetical protein
MRHSENTRAGGNAFCENSLAADFEWNVPTARAGGPVANTIQELFSSASPL